MGHILGAGVERETVETKRRKLLCERFAHD